MGNWLDTECLSGDKLTLYTVESYGEVTGLYGDEDWATENAEREAESGDAVVTLRRVTFRASRSVVLHRYAADPEDDEDEGEDDEGEDEAVGEVAMSS
jgi:hypothetical protein